MHRAPMPGARALRTLRQIQQSELRDESLLIGPVFEATQVEAELTVLDASDDRHRQGAKGRRQPVRKAAGAPRAGGRTEGQAGAVQPIDRQ